MREPTPHEVAILDAITDVARPIIRTAFRADSCIASTRIGIDVLAYFGIAARELPLTVMLFNREAAELLTSGTSMEDLAAQLAAIPADEPGGPWTIGVGAGGGAVGSWAGHMLITVPTLGVVMDLSLDQAARPHKNINPTPFWARIDEPDWWAQANGANRRTTLLGPDGTVMVLDRDVPDPLGYKTSTNWTKKGEYAATFKELNGQIIRQVRDRLP